VIEMSRLEDKVCNKIKKRAEVGKKKYGVTMERTDLTKTDWLVHLQEELMDAAVYIERLLEITKRVENEESMFGNRQTTLDEFFDLSAGDE
jgi:hypothetical protein